MTDVATLITDPAAGVLGDEFAASLAAGLPGAEPIEWLRPGVAARIRFDAHEAGRSPAYWRDELIRRIGERPVDVVVLPDVHRRKRLLIADMDSTIIEQECIDELADAAGLRAEVAAITARSIAGDVAFEESLRKRVALLRHLEVESVAQLVATRIRLMAGATTLVATMKKNGALTIIASGGFDLFTGRVAHEAGFDRHHGNRLGVADGRLTGRLVAPIAGPLTKRDILRSAIRELGIASSETLAVGDGANDLPMLREAGLGVAFRAHPRVAAQADAAIVHGDLTALLYLQGYRHSDFAV